MKKIFLASCFLLLASSCSPANSPTTAEVTQKYNYDRQLEISDKILSVEIANSDAAREQGLSDRASMEQNQGMLFDFTKTASSTPGTFPGFWMKDMKFDLDFIWIYKNKIVGITPSVPAFDQQKIYYPPSAIDWVLEVNSSWTKKNNIAVGDVVELK